MQPLLALHIINLITEAIATKTDFTSYSIRNAVKQGMPAVMIIKTIQEQHHDNPAAIVGLLGAELVERIVAYGSNK